MVDMKNFIRVAGVSLFLLSISTVSGWAGSLKDVHTVYLMPMANGLDQYLAVRLTTSAVFQVVTDPQKADAVLSDQVGQMFEEKMTDLYGQKPKADAEPTFARVGGMSRARGNLFLVDRKTREILWSNHEPLRGTNTAATEKTAGKIAEKLGAAVKGTPTGK